MRQEQDEAPYSNRELRGMFGDIKDTLERIEAQTTKTNGRVNKVEDRTSSLENYRYLMMGGLAVIVVLIAPLLLDLLRK